MQHFLGDEEEFLKVGAIKAEGIEKRGLRPDGRRPLFKTLSPFKKDIAIPKDD